MYTIGRADADIILIAPSISRHHAKLQVDYLDDNLAESVPSLSLTDTSRFGTLLNGIQVEANISITIPHESEITFGAMPGITVQ